MDQNKRKELRKLLKVQKDGKVFLFGYCGYVPRSVHVINDLKVTSSEETELPQPIRTRLAKNVSIHYTSWLVFVDMVTL